MMRLELVNKKSPAFLGAGHSFNQFQRDGNARFLVPIRFDIFRFKRAIGRGAVRLYDICRMHTVPFSVEVVGTNAAGDGALAASRALDARVALGSDDGLKAVRVGGNFHLGFLSG